MRLEQIRRGMEFWSRAASGTWIVRLEENILFLLTIGAIIGAALCIEKQSRVIGAIAVYLQVPNKIAASILGACLGLVLLPLGVFLLGVALKATRLKLFPDRDVRHPR